MLTVDAFPYEIDHQGEGLLQHLWPDHTNVSYESAVALLEILINIDASESMRHFLILMVSHNFQVVAFIAALHQLEQGFWIVERTPHLWQQLGIILFSELDEVGCSLHQRLQD